METDPLDRERFAEWVRECIRRTNLTQEQVAAQIGMSRVGLNYWSRGRTKSRPNWRKVQALAKLAQVDVDWNTFGSPVEDMPEGVQSSSTIDKSNMPVMERLSPAEHQIVQDLRNLTDAQVEHVKQYLAFLRGTPQQQQASNVLAMPARRR